MPDEHAPTTVDPQVTDAITQSNVTVLGSAPAMAVGSMQQATMHALTLAMHESVLAHQQLDITSQAAAVRGIQAMLGEASVESPNPSPSEEARADG